MDSRVQQIVHHDLVADFTVIFVPNIMRESFLVHGYIRVSEADSWSYESADGYVKQTREGNLFVVEWPTKGIILTVTDVVRTGTKPANVKFPLAVLIDIENTVIRAQNSDIPLIPKVRGPFIV